MIRVFLVENHELSASGVPTELGKQFELVGLIGVGGGGGRGRVRDRARRRAPGRPPAGWEAASVVERCPGVRFLALSVSDAAKDVIAVIRSGARGFVTKSISPAASRQRDP